MSIRYDLKRLERRFPRITRAVYEAALSRHMNRLSAVVEFRAGSAMRFFDGLDEYGNRPKLGPQPPEPDWGNLSVWERDQATIDSFHRAHFGQPDGSSLNAYGITPDAMYEHFGMKNMTPEQRQCLEEAKTKWKASGSPLSFDDWLIN